MIAGIGIDIIELERIDQALERYGDHFLEHVFSDTERLASPGGVGEVSYYAGRWAAKEAVSKALGTGIGERCRWKEICVISGPGGDPAIVLSGAAAETADRMGIGQIHITISHERKLACANAVAESSRKQESPESCVGF